MGAKRMSAIGRKQSFRKPGSFVQPIPARSHFLVLLPRWVNQAAEQRVSGECGTKSPRPAPNPARPLGLPQAARLPSGLTNPCPFASRASAQGGSWAAERGRSPGIVRALAETQLAGLYGLFPN